MREYLSIVFIHNEEAEEPLNILDNEGESAALQYLARWDYGENDGEIYDEIPAGSDDSIYHEDGYIMNYNTSLSYIGLCKMIET